MAKKALVVLAVLATATVANAKLILNINEVCDTITISGDGATASPVSAYLFVEGSGSIAGGNIVYPGSLSEYDDLETIAGNMGVSTQDALAAFGAFISKPNLVDLSMITLADGAIPPAPLQGTLVDGIGLTVTGTVVLTLMSDDFVTVFDAETIHVPEPVSLALLGLGGLLLRRKFKIYDCQFKI
jgi:hypothetical protein